MKRRQFRLVLEPAPEEVVRLTQLHRYAGDVAGHEASFPLQDAMAPSPFPQCRLPRCSLGFSSGNGS